MIVGVKTSGEFWAVVVAEDMDYIEQSVIDCIITAKKIYPNERITIDGRQPPRPDERGLY